jgi:hypothetical protein
VRCVDTLEYAVPTRRSSANVIETQSEPVDRDFKQMTSRHGNSAKSMVTFGHYRWRPFCFGQVAQAILWDAPLASHHVSRKFRASPPRHIFELPTAAKKICPNPKSKHLGFRREHVSQRSLSQNSLSQILGFGSEFLCRGGDALKFRSVALTHKRF